MTCINLLFILCIVFSVESKSNRKLILTWEQVVSCPNFDNVETDLSKAAIYMANETAVGLNGTIEIKSNFETGPLTVKSVVEKEVAGGQYMTMMSYDIKDLCEKIKDPDNTWGKYLQSLRPQPMSCAQFKNVYDITGLEPQSTDIELKKDMTGAYKVTIEMFAAANGIPRKVCCYQLNFNIDISS